MSDCGRSGEQLATINISDYNKELWQKMRQPLSVTFELTPRCNFRCIHCYLGEHRNETDELSTEQIISILDQLSDAGVLFVTFTGGECLLRSDFTRIYMYAKRLGFMVGIFTNAYTLRDEHFELFNGYPPFFVDVSIYAASEEKYFEITGIHGAFERVIKNLTLLKQYGIEFGIKTPLFSQNIEDYEKMCAIAKQLDVKYRFAFALSPTIDHESYPTTYMVKPSTMIRLESEDPVYREMGEHYAAVENNWGKAFDDGEFVPLFICNPGVNDLFIDYHGRAMPCASFRSAAISMLNTPFDEIWEDFSIYKKIAASANYRCMRCESRYYCRVCPADQLQYHGDYESIDPMICAHAHARKRLFKDHMPIADVIHLLKKEGIE